MRFLPLSFLPLLSLCALITSYQPIYNNNSQAKVTVRDSIREQLNGVFEKWGPPIKSKSDIYKPDVRSNQSNKIAATKEGGSKQNQNQTRNVGGSQSSPPAMQEKRVIYSSVSGGGTPPVTSSNTSSPSHSSSTFTSSSQPAKSKTQNTQTSSSQSTYIIVQQPDNTTQQFTISPSESNQIIVIMPPSSANNVQISTTQIKATNTNTQKGETGGGQYSNKYLDSLPPLPTLTSSGKQVNGVSKNNTGQSSGQETTTNSETRSSANSAVSSFFSSNTSSAPIYSLNSHSISNSSSAQSSSNSNSSPQTTTTQPPHLTITAAPTPTPQPQLPLLLPPSTPLSQPHYSPIPTSSPTITQSLNTFLSLDNTPTPIPPITQTILNVTQHNPIYILSRQPPTTPTAAFQKALNITSQMTTQQIILRAEQYMKNSTLIFQRCQNNYLSAGKSAIFLPSYRKCLTEFETSLYMYYSVLINYQEVLSGFAARNEGLTQRIADVVKVMQSVQVTIKEVNK